MSNNNNNNNRNVPIASTSHSSSIQGDRDERNENVRSLYLSGKRKKSFNKEDELRSSNRVKKASMKVRDNNDNMKTNNVKLSPNVINVKKILRRKIYMDDLIVYLKERNSEILVNYGIPSDWFEISVDVFNKYESMICIDEIVNIIKQDYNSWIIFYITENNYIIKSFKEYLQTKDIHISDKIISKLQYCYKHIIINMNDLLTMSIEEAYKKSGIKINEALFSILCKIMCVNGVIKSFVFEPYEYSNTDIKLYIKSILEEQELKYVSCDIEEEIDKINTFDLAYNLRLCMMYILEIMPRPNEGNDFLHVFTSEIKQKLFDSIEYYHTCEEAIHVKKLFTSLITLLSDALQKDIRYFIKMQLFNYIIDYINKIVHILNQYHQVTVIGSSGSGKSTLLDFICLDNINDVNGVIDKNNTYFLEIMKFRDDVLDFFQYKNLLNDAKKDFEENKKTRDFNILKRNIREQINSLKKVDDKISLSTYIFRTGASEEKSTTSVPQIVLYGERVIGCIYYKSLEEVLDELYEHFYNWKVIKKESVSRENGENFKKLFQFIFGVKRYDIILNDKMEEVMLEHVDNVFKFRKYLEEEMKPFEKSYINIFDNNTEIKFKMITGNKSSSIVEDITNLTIQKEKLIPSQSKYEEVLDNYDETSLYDKQTLRGVFASNFYCMVPNKTLKETGCVLVDTPGIDDQNRYRAKQALEQIEMTDTLVLAGLETSFARSGGYFFRDIINKNCNNIETYISYRKTDVNGKVDVDKQAITDALIDFDEDSYQIMDPKYFTNELSSFKNIEELIISSVNTSKHSRRNENMKQYIKKFLRKNAVLKNVINIFDKDNMKKINFKKEGVVDVLMNDIYPSNEKLNKLADKISIIYDDYEDQLTFQYPVVSFNIFYQSHVLKALIDEMIFKMFKDIMEIPEKIGNFIQQKYEDNPDIGIYLFEIIFKKDQFIDELNIITKTNKNSKRMNKLKKMIPGSIQEKKNEEEAKEIVKDFNLKLKEYLDEIIKKFINRYLNDTDSFVERFIRNNSYISRELTENEKENIDEVFNHIKDISGKLYTLYDEEFE